MIGEIVKDYGPTTTLIAIAAFAWVRFDWIDQRFAALEEGQAVLRDRLEDGQSAIRERLAKVEGRMDSFETRMGLFEGRMERIETKLDAILTDFGDRPGVGGTQPQ